MTVEPSSELVRGLFGKIAPALSLLVVGANVHCHFSKAHVLPIGRPVANSRKWWSVERVNGAHRQRLNPGGVVVTVPIRRRLAVRAGRVESCVGSVHIQWPGGFLDVVVARVAAHTRHGGSRSTLHTRRRWEARQDRAHVWAIKRLHRRRGSDRRQSALWHARACSQCRTPLFLRCSRRVVWREGV